MLRTTVYRCSGRTVSHVPGANSLNVSRAPTHQGPQCAKSLNVSRASICHYRAQQMWDGNSTLVCATHFQWSLYAPVCHTKQILQFCKSESRPFHKLTSQNRCDMVFLACGENLQRTRMFLHCRHGRLPLYLTIGHYFIYHHLIWYPILWLICTMRRTMSSEIVLFLHVQERPPDWKAF